nr:hypothetical protein CFP56_14703 [Quercus suber]
MTTFNKAKLTEIREKKAKHPSSPTSFLELITEDASKPKGKDKGSFWDDAGAAVLKAHEVISDDDLTSLGVRSSHELMSSHVHKVMQYLDYEEKYVVAKSKVESLSVENESLKSQISALAEKSRKDKELLKTLKKSLDTEKAFLRLKDKQIDEALLKVEKASLEAVEEFKALDEYSDKLCDYYAEGFDLFRKYLAKLHPELDVSKIDMEELEREILEDCPSEVATEVADSVQTNSSPSNRP